jgi:1,4-alpha-glucan branching enzyme
MCEPTNRFGHLNDSQLRRMLREDYTSQAERTAIRLELTQRDREAMRPMTQHERQVQWARQDNQWEY